MLVVSQQALFARRLRGRGRSVCVRVSDLRRLFRLTDIARGVAKLFGFELTLNFCLPYFSASPQEFWTRWHISLSRWLREYLYFSLGGNRQGEYRTYLNLILTMLIGGLWHGAAWNFVRSPDQNPARAYGSTR